MFPSWSVSTRKSRNAAMSTGSGVLLETSRHSHIANGKVKYYGD